MGIGRDGSGRAFPGRSILPQSEILRLKARVRETARGTHSQIFDSARTRGQGSSARFAKGNLLVQGK